MIQVQLPSGNFRPNKKPRFRVRIIDAQRTGYVHAGKEGWAQPGSISYGRTVEIVLDDGTIGYGYECWWEPVG